MASKSVALSGQKRRTIKCRCGAIVDFNKVTDVEPWCRHHSRSCYFMRSNFHKITDICWNAPNLRVRGGFNIDFKPDNWEGRLRSTLLPKSAPLPPPTVESLIGSVGGISILDAVEVLTRQDSIGSQSSTGTISTLSHGTPKPKKTVAKLPKPIEMIPAEVKLFILFYIVTWSNYHYL